MSRRSEAGLRWDVDGIDWPHRRFSRFVDSAGLRWHVQQMGDGPALLLLHGTGASTHSWRALAPLLATSFTVTLCDLPGHGFTAGRPVGGMSLDGISAALGTLLQDLGTRPQLAIGHSAGAAIAARMSLDGRMTPRALISLNGAFLPLSRLPEMFFSPLAKILAGSQLAARVFAWGARDRASVERLIASTGSTLDDAGVEFYWRLVRSSAHVDGALQMMAHWDLHSLERDLWSLKLPLTLVVGSADRTVPPAQAERVRQLTPRSGLIVLPRLGHLAHEEDAPTVAAVVHSVAAPLNLEFADA